MNCIHPFGSYPVPLKAPRSTGVSGWFGDTLSWLMGYDLDEIRQQMDEANAKLRELNEDLYRRGKISREQLEQMNRQLEQEGVVNFSRQVEEGFWQGVDEGYLQVTQAIRNTLNKTGGFVVRSIPWWLWALGGLYLLHQMGLLKKWSKTT